jgi:hypothetical protein
MSSDRDMDNPSRRNFLKTAGIASAAAMIGAASLANAESESHDPIMAEYWEKKQKEYEALEEEARKDYKAYDSPPKYIYRGTDYIDKTPTFYAPLMQECEYLPEFQSIYTSGTAGQYFKHTLAFGMKDIIRFHGHSCEALYYTAAICRLICDKLFEDGVVDRTILRGRGGESP